MKCIFIVESNKALILAKKLTPIYDKVGHELKGLLRIMKRIVDNLFPPGSADLLGRFEVLRG